MRQQSGDDAEVDEVVRSIAAVLQHHPGANAEPPQEHPEEVACHERRRKESLRRRHAGVQTLDVIVQVVRGFEEGCCEQEG